ncbi:hypothetical protein K227x_07480 [Rubripirellula lacrimiformis]|uniref:Uncharacterized protein n=1 Tax=Rubripirellula lacrimiformis TaxID=1930273 RepID=A0A517N5G3_9BACT|nr:hypothetical protein K227x_07480 [Rubripirellula lacrimiformis]
MPSATSSRLRSTGNGGLNAPCSTSESCSDRRTGTPVDEVGATSRVGHRSNSHFLVDNRREVKILPPSHFPSQTNRSCWSVMAAAGKA